MEVVLAGLAGLLLALVAGWALWGGPLARARAEAAEHRTKLQAALVEGGALTARHAALEQTHDARVTEHDRLRAAHEVECRQHADARALLAGHAATQAERDRAHGEQLERLRAEFAAMAGTAMADAQARFVELADTTLKHHRAEAASGLDASKASLAALLTPVQETLGRYETELKAIEAARNDAYGGLRAQIADMAQGQQRVQAEASRLVTALRSSGKTSGAWGELQLENVLEKAGLKRGIDFELQVHGTGEDGGRRPDAVIKLPGGGRLIVDSKCSLNDYLSAVEADDEDARQAALDRHLACVKAHVKGLGAKAYWREQGGSGEFVALFMPGDNLLAAALERDPALLGWAREQRVLLTGPTNLVALATNVALVRRQEKLAEEAEAIGKVGGQLHDALAIMADHIAKLGAGLGKAVESYNGFVGSLENRVLPPARRLPGMGAKIAKPAIAELATVDSAVRPLAAPEILSAVAPPLLAAE